MIKSMPENIDSWCVLRSGAVDETTMTERRIHMPAAADVKLTLPFGLLWLQKPIVICIYAGSIDDLKRWDDKLSWFIFFFVFSHCWAACCQLMLVHGLSINQFIFIAASRYFFLFSFDWGPSMTDITHDFDVQISLLIDRWSRLEVNLGPGEDHESV